MSLLAVRGLALRQAHFAGGLVHHQLAKPARVDRLEAVALIAAGVQIKADATRRHGAQAAGPVQELRPTGVGHRLSREPSADFHRRLPGQKPEHLQVVGTIHGQTEVPRQHGEIGRAHV